MKLRLTIDVEYDPNTTNEKSARALLSHIPQDAANRGLFTGETPAVVTSWSHSIETIPVGKLDWNDIKKDPPELPEGFHEPDLKRNPEENDDGK